MTALRRLRVALGIVVLTGVTAASLPGQTPVGDSAWTAGRFDLARTAYSRALAEDSLALRPLYRLAIMASWDGKLDSALVLIRRARRVDPADPDLALEEAQVLAWRGNLEAALARYDSITTQYPYRRDAALARALALGWANRFDQADSIYRALLRRDPEDLDAQAGRAQLWAWRGDLDRAEGAYRAVLSQQPGNADALAGLSQVHHWMGRDHVARREAARALALDSTNQQARQVAQAIRTELRPTVEFRVEYTRDSDHNTSWSETASAGFGLSPGVRGFVSGGLQQSESPAAGGASLDATRSTGEVGLTADVAMLRLTGAVGGRRLAPDAGAARNFATWRGALGFRLTPRASLSLGYAHWVFDETAELIARGLKVDGIEAGFDATTAGGTVLTLGGGRAWVSGPSPADDNTRTSAIAAVTVPVARRFFVGLFGRGLGYAHSGRGFGYFAPDRFTVAEVRAGLTLAGIRWEAGLSGGAGLQWVSRDASSQGEWHLEARVGRHWGTSGLAELFGALTNSLVTSTSGAYRYGTAGLRVRIGL